MTLGQTILRGLAPLAAGGVLLAVFACTGGDNDGSTTLGGKTLSECEYADTLTAKLDSFSTGIGALLDTHANRSEPAKAFDTLDAQLAGIITEMKTLKSTKEVNEVNQAFISALEGLRKDLPEARKAAADGDLTKMATETNKAIEAFGAKVEKSEKEHSELSSRLTQCGS